MEKAPLRPCEQVSVAKWLCSNLFMCFRLLGQSLAAYASMIYETFLSLSCHQSLDIYLNRLTARLFPGLVWTPSSTCVRPHQAEADEMRLCFPLAVLTRLSARPQCDRSWRGKRHPSVRPWHRHVPDRLGDMASVSQPGPEEAAGGHGSPQRWLWCRRTSGFYLWWQIQAGLSVLLWFFLKRSRADGCLKNCDHQVFQS